MTAAQSSDKNIKKVSDVRIVSISDIPARYFAHEAVIEAIRRVVRTDVVVRGKDVPPGASAVFGSLESPKALMLKLSDVRSKHPFIFGFMIGWFVSLSSLIVGVLF